MSLCAIPSEHSDGNVQVNATSVDTVATAGTLHGGAIDGLVSYHVQEPKPYSSAEAFLLKSISDSTRTASLLVQPEILIPRYCLPLCCLDLPSHGVVLQLDQPLCGHVEALENEFSTRNQVRDTSVLVVRIDGHAGLYVIERIYPGTYTVIKLRSWVKASHLAALTVKTTKRRRPNSDNEDVPLGGDHWWAEALLKDGTSLSNKRSKLCHATAVKIQLPEVIEFPTEPTDDDMLEKASLPNDHSEAQDMQELENDMSSMADEAHINIVQQYLDTLYLSKAPLTYFAKGPLSRARAKVSQGHRHFIQYTSMLAERLRCMISSPSMIDKKYRDTIPEMIKSNTKRDSTSMEKEHSRPRLPRQRRKSKKPKLGRSGLFGTEEEFVVHWWSLDEESHIIASPTDDFDSMARRRLSSLKFRDNLLQIIISLEILALESFVAKTNTQSCTDHDTRTQGDLLKPQIKPKARKIQDIRLYLDVLIDRLCIWQSTFSSGAIKTSGDHTDSKDYPTRQAEANGSSIELKEFCIDVVVPFYGGRLSHIVEKLGKTLGIKLGPSPSKRSLPKSSTKTKRVRPETEHKKSPSRREGRSKEVGNDLLENIKRERSATPQSALSFKTERRPFSRASSVSQSQSFKKREIDFSAINKFNETKSKKKAKIEHELHEAIANLKKPNRVSAVKDYFDEKDLRIPVVPSKLSSKMQRKSTPLDVQVGATPKKGITSFGEPKDLQSNASAPAISDVYALVSPQANVPASTTRPQNNQATPSSRTYQRTSSTVVPQSDILDTPSKPQRFLKPPIKRDAVPTSSPVLPNLQHVSTLGDAPRAFSREAQCVSTPTKTASTSAKTLKSSLMSSERSFGTSKSSNSNLDSQSGSLQANFEKFRADNEHRSEATIYEQLGWNEDYVDDI